MAAGRMLNCSIAEDKLFARLLDEAGPLAAVVFYGLIPFQDRDGRVHGDPLVLKGKCWPRAASMTPAIIEAGLRACHEIGLLIWYEAGGDRWVCFPNFRKNQPNAQLNRERESTIPPPPQGMIDEWRAPRMTALAQPVCKDMPDNTRPHAVTCNDMQLSAEWKGREEKGTEGKGADPTTAPLHARPPDPAPRRPWKDGQPIASVSDLVEAASVWGWSSVGLGIDLKARGKRVIDAGPIQPDEYRTALPKASGKRDADGKLRYLLGTIEGKRRDAVDEAKKPPTERAPPLRGRGWDEYVDDLPAPKAQTSKQ